MTKGDFLAAYNIGHRDGKEDVYCPNDYDDIFKLSEDEKVIRIKKGTLKVRTGRYVIYDVEWLKEHFNTTEAKIYGQPSEDCISRKFMHDMGATCIAGRNKDGDLVALGALDLLPSVTPQPNEDCISRKAVLDALHSYFAKGFNEDRWWNSTYVLDAINKVLSIAPQPKTGQQAFHVMKGHWIEHKHGGIEHIECSKCRCWFLRKNLIRNSYCPNCGSYNGGTK